MISIYTVVLTKTDSPEIRAIHEKMMRSWWDTTENYFTPLVLCENNSGGSEEFVKFRSFLDAPGTDEALRCYAGKNAHLICLPGKFHMNRFYNQGFEYLVNRYGKNPDYVIFMNSDLIFHKNWLDRCLKAFVQLHADMVIPSSAIQTRQWRLATEDGTTCAGGFRVTKERDDVCLIEDNHPGWMFFMTGRAWEKVGPWEEELEGAWQDRRMYDIFDQHGLSYYSTRYATVDHLESKTFTPLLKTNPSEYHRLAGPAAKQAYERISKKD